MFISGLKRFLPGSLTSDTSLYARASVGVIAAYTATFNPIASALILVGHGAWEYAGYLMGSAVSLQQKRIDIYNEAFSELVGKARAHGSACTNDELVKARNIFLIHNLIEEICYSALADIVAKLDIREDKITEEQSRLILAYVKQMAHVELRREGGYSKKGREMISPEQFSGVMSHVATIIHDRDGRLTDARYYTLTDLCTALDDHNSYVKNILFRSWLRCGTVVSETHLGMVKDLVNFDTRMSEQVGFDFSRTLADKKMHYDKIFPAVREVVCSRNGEKTALRFVNLTEVRTKLEEHVDTLLGCDPKMPLATALVDHCSMTADSVATLLRDRHLPCEARFGSFGGATRSIFQPPLLRSGLSVGEFVDTYFPDKARSSASLVSL